ncbi:MAG: murein L,D-transpeptidase catalytic domain family protein [Deltaproteobacteria bacterium]|nr:murein L,D-transpeptidase catalytic domain family protein [Deltaproteobacteria bacterium]
MRPNASRVRVGAWLAAAVALAGCAAEGSDELDLGATEAAVDVAAFQLPSLDAAARAAIVHRYDALDPGDEIPRGLLEDAIVYYDVNRAQLPKPEAFVVVDLSRYSGRDRFWLVDTATGLLEAHKVAHGDGSDPDNDGYATLFGNVDGSHMSSLGFYLTGEIYDGTHPHSMRLDGLSVDGSPNDLANSNVRTRLIVVHEADYVSDSNTGQQGRSNGCLALDPAIEVGVVDRIHDGTLIYAAIAPLAPPVGRAACGDGVCDGAEDATSCAADCAPVDPGAPDGGVPDPGAATGELAGGCAAGGSGSGAGLAIAFALVGLRRRRR